MSDHTWCRTCWNHECELPDECECNEHPVLLTREEAANDPQVQEMIAQFILKASGWDDR